MGIRVQFVRKHGLTFASNQPASWAEGMESGGCHIPAYQPVLGFVNI